MRDVACADTAESASATSAAQLTLRNLTTRMPGIPMLPSNSPSDRMSHSHSHRSGINYARAVPRPVGGIMI